MVRSMIVATVLTAGLAFSGGVQAAWEPDKPITIIVPWSAGGSTDQVTRVVAGELEEGPRPESGDRQPARCVGARSAPRGAWDADHDGYTWAAGAASDLGTYPVLDMLDVTLDNWSLFLNVAMSR